MGTRSNVIVRNGQTVVYLYRHWDGYLAENGKDIANALIAAGNNAGQFIAALLTKMEEDPGYRAAKPQYEITASLHGDIEYLYQIDFDPSYMEQRAPRVGYVTGGFSDEKVFENFAACRLTGASSLESFVSEVNKAIASQNQRGRKLAAEQPAAYGDFEPAAMIEFPAKAVAA